MDEMEFIDEEMPLVNDDELFSESTKTNIQRPHLNSTTPLDFPVTRYENHGGAFTTGIDIFSREEKLKMEERAKRFGLTDKLHLLSDQEQDLYASMGIKEGSDNIKNIRFNVLHMRGTENMSTKDVFKYFEGYAPASIEWISDVSCNVVWLDSISAARALLGLSKKISFNHSNDDCVIVEKDADNKLEGDRKPDNNSINVKDIHYPIPPGIWRKGVDHSKSKCILLRFANRSDKQQPHTEKLSEYHKKYGSPKSAIGLRGILSESRKRTYKQSKRKLLSDDALLQNDPSKKMYVKNPWGDLSQNWGVNDSVEDYYVQNPPEIQVKRTSVKERLGLKQPLLSHEAEDSLEHHNNANNDNDHDNDNDDDDENSSSDSEEDWCKRSKVLRMRMHADDEEEKVHKRRARIQSQKLLNHLRGEIDLRSRLGRSKPQTQFCDTIQVVVTNPKASNISSAKTLDGSEEEDGEIVDDDDDEDKATIPKWIGNHKEQREQIQDEEEPEEEEEEEEEEDDDEQEHDDDRDDSEPPPVKEAQGPKGSVIKVVERKPRVASTVWARLNHVKSEISKPQASERQSSGGRDLRDTLKGGDLRSRIGNRTRGRSPLRIEVKNDKYTEEDSDSE